MGFWAAAIPFLGTASKVLGGIGSVINAGAGIYSALKGTSGSGATSADSYNQAHGEGGSSMTSESGVTWIKRKSLQNTSLGRASKHKGCKAYKTTKILSWH